jgi:hypothetical protein
MTAAAQKSELPAPKPVEPGSIVHAMKFFDIPIAKFRAEWEELSDQDKLHIRSGLKSASLTY